MVGIHGHHHRLSGQTAYSGAVVTDDLTGLLNDAAYNGDAAGNAGGRCRTQAPMLTWTGDLSRGDSVTVTYSVTVDNPDTGGKLLSNNGYLGRGVGRPARRTRPGGSCRVTITVLTPALTIVKTASTATAVPGQAVIYTITVTDSGQTPYSGATLTDDLTGVLGDAAYNGDASATAGLVSYASPTLTWTGNLSAGRHRDRHLHRHRRQPRHRRPRCSPNTVPPQHTVSSNCPCPAAPIPGATATVVSAKLRIVPNTASA